LFKPAADWQSALVNQFGRFATFRSRRQPSPQALGANSRAGTVFIQRGGKAALAAHDSEQMLLVLILIARKIIPRPAKNETGSRRVGP